MLLNSGTYTYRYRVLQRECTEALEDRLRPELIQWRHHLRGANIQ